MDIKEIMSTLMSDDSVKSISKKTGASTTDVTSILSSALPSLLEGVSSQASGKSTAANFATAILSHASDDTSNLSSFMKNVDLDDGAKILSHLLGSSNDSTTKAVSKKSGTSSATTLAVLTAAAPLLLSLLGKQASSSSSSNSTDAVSSLVSAALGKTDTSSLLTSVLGAVTGTSSNKKTDTASAALNLLGNILKK